MGEFLISFSIRNPNVPLLQDLHKVLAMIDGAPSLDSVEALRSSHDEKCPDLHWLDWPPLTSDSPHLD